MGTWDDTGMVVRSCRARYRVIVILQISDFMYVLMCNNTVFAFTRPELPRQLPITRPQTTPQTSDPPAVRPLE